MEVEMTVTEKGSRIWHKKDRRYHYHREDGPAIIYDDGVEAWYLNDWYYSMPNEMPLNLFLAYVKWEYRKKHGN